MKTVVQTTGLTAKLLTCCNGKFKTLLIGFALVIGALFSGPKAFAGNETIEAHSLIINMGVVPQTTNNALKPYGLVYQLLNTYGVPIKWVINPSKTWQANDFSYNGKSYKAGCFIIPNEFRTPSVNALINTFKSQGVVIDSFTTSATVPVYTTLTAVPRWTLDAQNGAIAVDWMNAAGIPSNAYNFNAPGTLTCCDDLFVMPHADPCWSTHGHLLEWNLNCKGGIWAGCHAVSALEDMFNPANPSQQTNFLSNKTGTATGTSCYSENALILWTNHTTGSVPYVQNTTLAADPFMQFMGITDAATQNGSEQIYLPKASGWRASTNIAVSDPSQANVPALSAGPAAQIAYGRGFGDPNRGWVLYEAGHDIFKAAAADNIAAVRVFFNWSLISMTDKSVNVTVSGIPANMEGAVGYPLTSSVSGGSGVYSYVWTATYANGNSAGTFSPNNTAANPTFTPTQVLSNTSVTIKVIVTDNCGRKSFSTTDVTVTPGPRPPVAVNDIANIPEGCTTSSATIDVLANDSDPDGGPLTVTLIGSGNNGTFVNNGGGIITYIPNQNFSGADFITYQLCDNTALCATATIIVTVGSLDVHGCTSSEYYGTTSSGVADTAIVFTSVTNPDEVSADPDAVTAELDNNTDVLVVLLTDVIPASDTAFVHWKHAGPGSSTMTVEQSADGTTFSNLLSFTTNSASVIISNYVVTAGTEYLRIKRTAGKPNIDAVTFDLEGCVYRGPVAANFNSTILEDTRTSFNALGQSSDPLGATMTVNNITVEPLHGTAAINPNGTITYQPNTDYSGADSFKYQICNSNGYCSTGNAVVSITDDACANLFYKAVSGSSGTLTLDATIDLSLKKDKKDNNFGTCTKLYVDREGSKPERALLKFDVSGIPGGAIISSSVLTLDKTGGKSASMPIGLHNVTKTWVEGTKCDKGGDPSWKESASGTAWTTEGGDYTALAAATTTVSGNGFYSWNINTLVNGWVTTPSSNLGVLLKAVTESGGDNSMQFASREEGVTTKRPKLVISYIVPGSCAAILNRAPLAKKDFATTQSVKKDTILVLANDVDPDAGNTMTVTGIIGTVSPGGSGTATFTAGSVIFTPTLPFNGVATILYKVTDNNGASDTGIVQITVTNSAPIAVKDVASGNSGANMTITVKSNDSDPDGNATTAPSIISGPQHGTASVSGNNVLYTSAIGYTGKDTLVYQICEASSGGCNEAPLCDTAMVVITVNNQPPVAVNDVATTNECKGVTILITANDTDPENGVLTASIVSNPTNGTVVLIGNDALYTPNSGYLGADAFTYKVCDDGTPVACSGNATVNITVSGVGVNAKPVAGDDIAIGTVNQPIFWDILTNDSDPDNNDFTASLPAGVLQPAHGTATVLANGLLEYIPAPGFIGIDALEYVICDAPVNPGGCTQLPSKCDTARVDIVVNPPSAPGEPTANADHSTTNLNTAVDIDVLINDDFGINGPSSGAITVTTNAAHGTAVVNTNSTPNDPTDDFIEYTPNTNYFGSDNFIYQICDGDGDCDTAIVFVTILNQVPIAVNDVNTTNEDTPVPGNASTNDTPSGDGGNVWTLIGVNGGAANGTVTMNPDGSYLYTPNANYNGTDVFTYHVCDINGDCSTATVTITINPVDDAPVAVNDVNTTNEDTPVPGNASTNDTPSGDGGNVWTLIGVDGGAANGTVTMNPDGSYVYTPDPNYNGTDVFNYQVCDVDGDCSTATVTITINPVDDAPVAVNDVNTTNEDTPVPGNASTNDTPSGDGGNVWTLIGVDGGAANGTVTMNPDGSYVYTPDPNYNGTDVFNYQVCDVDGDCSTATVTITINPVDDAPVAVNDVNTTNEDTPVPGNASTNDTPSGDGGNVWTLIGVDGGAANGTVTMNPDGSYVYTPDPNYNGTDVFTYQVCDVDGDCSTATVTITINPVDDAPVAVNDVNTTNEDTPVPGNASTNDTPSGDGGNVWTLIGVDGGAANGTVTMNPDGSYVYTPDPNFNGTDVFTYQVCDVDGDCSTATVTITINPVDDAPVAVNDVNTTNEDTPVPGNASTNDTPSGDGGNVWTLVGPDGGASNGTVTMNPDGSYVYTPDPNYNGTDVFNYQVCDVDGDCSTATVTITINPVDDAPVAVNDVNTTNEDTPVPGNASTNDTPSGDGGNVWTLVGPDGGASNGTVTMNPDGSYVYTPDPNYNGTDVFTYQVCDVDGDCSTATVTITINPADDVPVAVNDTYFTNQDVDINSSVAGNDTPSPDGGNVWTLIGVDGGAAHGNVTMNPDGSFTFTPDAGYVGTDQFTYQVCDVDGDCSTAVANITIDNVDEQPVAVNDVNTTNEDTPVPGNASTNDTPSGDGGNVWTLIGVDGGAANGTVTMNPDGSYVYTPDPNYNGTDVFNYQVCDVDGDCSTATVTITINPVDDAPVAVNDVNTTNEDTPVPGNASTNDTPSGDGGNVWTLIGVDGGAANGTVTMNPDGSYVYTPDPNYNGTDVFNYQVCDVDGDCSTATVTITINPVDDAPVAVNDVNTTNEDTPVPGNASTNDTPSGDGGNVWTLIGVDGGAANGTVTMNPDGSYVYTPEVNDVNTTNEDTPVPGNASTNDTPSGDGGNVWTLIGVDGGAANGTVTMNPDGSYVYTPDPNYNGTDVFNYQVCDVDGDCSTATVTITINPVDDAPVAVNDVNTTNEDTPVPGNASTNDTPSGDGGNVWTLIGVDGGAANGTVTMNPDGSYVYTPDPNYNGTDVFTYQVCDVDGDCSTATVTITINPVDDAPVAVNDVNTTNEDTPVPGNASTNDTPSGDGGNVWTLVGPDGGASNGTVTMNPDGSYVYTPDPNYNGTDVFNYQVCDVDGDCSTATVTITINPVDDAPVAVNDVNTTNEDTPVPGNASTNDTPSGDGGNVWTLVGPDGGASNGTVTMNPDGSYVYTPDPNYNGTDVFTYQVCDVDGDCSTATVTITINPVDDAPVAVNDVNTTDENTAVNGDASTNDTPSGDGGNVWTLIGVDGGAANGTVTMNPDGSYTYTPDLNYFGTDVFNYQVCDVDGDCSAATVTITIIEKVCDITVNAGPDLTKCHGKPIMLSAVSNDQAASYSWSPATGLDNANIANPTCNVGSSTTYTVTVTAANGCTASDDVNVVAFAEVKAKITIKNNNASCGAPCKRLSTPFNANYVYTWKFNSKKAPGNSSSNTYCACASGTYAVWVTDTTNGCTHHSKKVEITIGQKTEDGDQLGEVKEIQINAWPNPTSNNLNVSILNVKEGAVTVQLLDMFGRVMHVVNLNGDDLSDNETITFNMEQLSAGMYFVRMINGDFKAEQKVMLIK
ncbi:MAG: tandem-95 repeat protein [Chitinophagaceae bacterium]|nr:tandem-95 repeat protein [Chitinophagaceae bacterium]